MSKSTKAPVALTPETAKALWMEFRAVRADVRYRTTEMAGMGYLDNVVEVYMRSERTGNGVAREFRHEGVNVKKALKEMAAELKAKADTTRKLIAAERGAK